MAMNFNEKSQLFAARLRARIDTRTTACRVTPEKGAGTAVTITGFSQYPQTDAFVRALANEIFGEANTTFQLTILSKGAPRFAVVTSPAAPIWRNPDDSNPELLDSQALFGSIVRTWHKDGKFTFVQHPDGYVGFLPSAQLKSVTADQYLGWKNAAHYVTLVPVPYGQITIPPGARLTKSAGRALLPDGKSIRLTADQAIVHDPARSGFIRALKKQAKPFMNTPYLWGGKSEIGIDCSGFVQTLALQQGIILPRDASMQAHVGEIVGYLPQFADLLPGDIMFFMNENAYVFHVGIYLGNHQYMHSAGATGPTISSVFPKGKNYMGRYGTSFVYARRVHV